MWKLNVPFLLLSSIACACLPECHPDYQEWLNVGAPESWCYPRQCRGDTNGIKSGPFHVNSLDLSTLNNAFKIKQPPFGPGISVGELGADFDHRKSGSPYNGYYRVGANDACILAQYFLVTEADIPLCDFGCPIENNVIDGPKLSLRSKVEMSFSDSSLLHLYPEMGTEIGIVNDSTDKCTSYDAYVSITNGHENGAWTDYNWVYNSSYLEWIYFGTADIAGMDTWYVNAINFSESNSPAAGTVSSSVGLRYDGPGSMTVRLYNEYFEEVDTLIIEGPIVVLSPSGGDTLVSGQSHDITWRAHGLISTVNIEYSIDNGSHWTSIAADVPNTGIYTWNPVVAANSDACLVRILDSFYPQTSDISDAAFTIFICTDGPIAGDLNQDCYVNLADFAVLCESWMICGNPFDSLCTGN